MKFYAAEVILGLEHMHRSTSYYTQPDLQKDLFFLHDLGLSQNQFTLENVLIAKKIATKGASLLKSP